MAYATIDKGSKYFNTKLYTGDSTTANSVTGVGFQPDLVWIKGRNAVLANMLQDSVRGSYKYLVSNSTGAENTNSNYDWFKSFNSDGFTVAYTSSDSTPTSEFNNSSYTYASWSWKANGTGVSNTAGTISSTVSANTTSGFSIVRWSGSGANATVGHGIGTAPKMIIIKNYDANLNDWVVYHSSIGNGAFLRLNTTNASQSATNIWNSTSPTSSVFSLGTAGGSNGSGTNNMIAYCFAEVKGYSKFGSYVGNGNANGTFTYTGFRPSFFLIKNTTTAGNGWHIFDNKRIGFNTSNYQLSPSDSGAEDTTTGYTDILSNGFKMRSTNDFNNKNGDTYIYMAFAENPFVSSKGIPTTAR